MLRKDLLWLIFGALTGAMIGTGSGILLADAPFQTAITISLSVALGTALGSIVGHTMGRKN